MAEQWLSIVEYARTFAVSDMTVRRRIKTGKLKAVLKEGKYYIPVAAGHVPEGDVEELEVAPSFANPLQMMGQALSPPTVSRNLAEPQANVAAQSLKQGASSKGLPGHISQSLQKYDNTLVDSQALLQFCEHSVTRINSIEKHLQESFQLKILALEAQLKLKDQAIIELKQQVEDLQMLVKLMEKS